MCLLPSSKQHNSSGINGMAEHWVSVGLIYAAGKCFSLWTDSFPWNSAVRNWPHQSCELGWGMVAQGWPRPCGSVNAQISCAGSMSKAWAMLFPWNLLIYCFVLLTVTRIRAWLTYLLSKTFYSLIVAVFHPQHRREMPRKRTPGKPSTYKALPQHAGASKGQGVSQEGIIKGHQEPHWNMNHIMNAILWFYGL